MQDYYIEVMNTKGHWSRVLLIDFDKDGVLVKPKEKRYSLVLSIICLIKCFLAKKR